MTLTRCGAAGETLDSARVIPEVMWTAVGRRLQVELVPFLKWLVSNRSWRSVRKQYPRNLNASEFIRFVGSQTSK